MEKDDRYEKSVRPQQDAYYTQLPDEPSVEEYIGEESVWSEDISQEKRQGTASLPTDLGDLGTGPFMGGEQKTGGSAMETGGIGTDESANSPSKTTMRNESGASEEPWTARAQVGINVPGAPDPRASADDPLRNYSESETYDPENIHEPDRNNRPAHREPDSKTGTQPSYREPADNSEPSYREPRTDNRNTNPGQERHEEPGMETETVVGPNASARMEANIGSETDTGQVTNPEPDSFFATKHPER